MELTTERLVLRELEKKDAKNIQELLKNIEISSKMLVVPHPYQLKHAKTFIQDAIDHREKHPRKNYVFAVTLKPNKELIGIVDLRKVDKFHGTAEIGYWLGQKYWGQGIMTEAGKEVIKFAFNKLKLRRVNADAYADNPASNKVITKLGFKFEGRFRKSLRCKADRKIHDTNNYGLLKEEWKG